MGNDMTQKHTGRRTVLLGGLSASLLGCSTSKITRRYTGPTADGIIVRKSQRQMFVLNGSTVLAAHDVDLGFAPTGHKTRRGDGRTPEGQYYIDRRNYNSSFFLSLGISYPNAADVARAQAQGQDPGGDIFIHGMERGRKRGTDWTAGCISVSDAEMEMLYQMVPIGTPIWIQA